VAIAGPVSVVKQRRETLRAGNSVQERLSKLAGVEGRCAGEFPATGPIRSVKKSDKSASRRSGNGCQYQENSAPPSGVSHNLSLGRVRFFARRQVLIKQHFARLA
jgi:hypothetical protein